MSTFRAAVAVLLLAFAAAATRVVTVNTRAADAALDRVPYTIGPWKGTDAPPPDPETQETLGADAVLNRTYALQAEHGAPAREWSGVGGPARLTDGAEPRSSDEVVGLYIAYYREQRPGVSVHSPLHCLPGTGWEIEDGATITIPGAGLDGRMKRLVVRKNMDRALVLYAYSVHGRLIANEVLSKLWLLNDRIRRGRGDAALVRIVVPVMETMEAAEQRGRAFTRDVLPHVLRLWS
jgi:EpsI family protein